MKLGVLMKQVPDLVEELEVDGSGKLLDRSWLRFIPSEYDEHALEQALLIKEKVGGSLRVFALDIGDSEEMLYSALAKGADEAYIIAGSFENGIGSKEAAALYARILKDMGLDLIMTGVQAIDDLDGSTGAFIAGALGLPYVGVISGVTADEGGEGVVVRKEYPGGRLAEISVALPAVLGIQSAEQPPRYVPIARIQKARKEGKIERIEGGIPQPEAAAPALEVLRMVKPETGDAAQMIEGNPDDVAASIIEILKENGLVR